jgi:hypothetical protein
MHLLRGFAASPQAPPQWEAQPCGGASGTSQPQKPPSASQAASELLSRLPHEHQFALGGLIAALLGSKGSNWGDAFCRGCLRKIALSALKLPVEHLEALLPIYEHNATAKEDAKRALISLLPAEEEERAALLLALLAVTILSEDAQTEGYDARSRQLLVELANTLGVPWQKMAEMERQLADSMRAQAASLAALQESAEMERRAPAGAAGSAACVPGKKPYISAKWRRRAAVAGIGVASGLAIGLTAGLAAPAVLAGLGAVGTGIAGIGGAVGAAGLVGSGTLTTAVGASIVGITAVLQGSIGVTVVTTLFGATGAGLASLKLNRRLGDVQEFEFAQPPSAAERHAKRGSEESRMVGRASSASALVDAKGDAKGDPEGGKDVDEAAEAAFDGTDGLVVVVCVSGWLAGDTDTPQQHWWGDVAEVPSEAKEGKEGKGAAGAAGAPAASGFPPRPSWPEPMPALPPTPAALAAHEIRASAAELEARRQQELISALVEMGFPQHAAREAAPRHVRLEEIVEELLGNGFKPSLTSTGETVQGGEVAALRRMSLGAKMASRQLDPPTPPPLPFAVMDGVVAAAATPEAAAAASSASRAAEQGAGGRQQGEAGNGLGVTSFVQIDEAPGRSALECLPHAEHHVLLWESKELRVLGNALGHIDWKGMAVSTGASAALHYTFLASLMAAVAMPAYLVKACDVIDNPWAIGFKRAQKAGALLAHVLLERTHGKRPVILSGFGLGARVIFDCLLVLAEALKRGDVRAAGVIQHVVLMGLPATADPEVWKGLRLVVAGRIVNCYRPNDLVLLIVHRAANMTYGVAGLGEVSCDSVENYDVSGIVHAHGKYRRQTGAVFDLVGLEQCDRAPSVERDDEQ